MKRLVSKDSNQTSKDEKDIWNKKNTLNEISNIVEMVEEKRSEFEDIIRGTIWNATQGSKTNEKKWTEI